MRMGRALASGGHKKRGISPIIAELMLVVIAVSAGYFLYGYLQSYMAQMTANTRSPSLITIDAAGLNHDPDQGRYYVFIAIRNIGSTPATVVGIILLDPEGLSLVATAKDFTSTVIDPGSSRLLGTHSIYFDDGIGSSGQSRILKVITSDGSSATMRISVPP